MNTISPRILYHLLENIIFLRILSLREYHLFENTISPRIPYLREFYLSENTISSRIPSLREYHLSKNAIPPRIPFWEYHLWQYVGGTHAQLLRLSNSNNRLKTLPVQLHHIFLNISEYFWILPQCVECVPLLCTDILDSTRHYTVQKFLIFKTNVINKTDSVPQNINMLKETDTVPLGQSL